VAGFNPYAPFARVVITNADQATWVMAIGPWPSSNAPGDALVMGGPFVTSVSVTVSQGGTHDGITIGFSAPYQEGINLIEQGCFDHMNFVTVELGYQAGPSTMVTDTFFGFLGDGGEGLVIGSDGVTGSVVAKYTMRQTDYVKKGLPGATKTAANMLMEHATAVGLTLVAMGDGATKVAALSALAKDAKVESTYYGVEGSVGHFDIVRKILELAGVSWHLGNVTMMLGKAGTMEPAQPALFYYDRDYAAKLDPIVKLVMRGGFDPSSTPPVYPILDCSVSSGAAMWQEGRRWKLAAPSGRTAGVQVATVDKDTGYSIALHLPPTYSELPNLGGASQIASTAADDKRGAVQADAAIDGDAVVGGRVVQAVPSGAVTDALIKRAGVAALDNAADSFALVMTVTTLGMPTIAPAQPVSVYGCSHMFNGPFVVRKVTHNYAPGDWKTVLEIQRWGTLQKANLAKTVSAGTEAKEGT
jgi:hypothetical protein